MITLLLPALKDEQGDPIVDEQGKEKEEAQWKVICGSLETLQGMPQI